MFFSNLFFILLVLSILIYAVFLAGLLYFRNKTIKGVKLLSVKASNGVHWNRVLVHRKHGFSYKNGADGAPEGNKTADKK